MANLRPLTTPASLQQLPDSDALIVGQGAVVSEQASSLSTPSSGYGVIYAKTDGKAYFKNDAGTEYDLTRIGTNPIIREYTANNTWTKPTADNFYGVIVCCVGAGGGGGSGRRGAASSSRSGGSGAGGACISYRFIQLAQLPNASYSITIGTGGAGGAARTTDNTSGATGSPGGDTSFGSLVVSKGGNGGNAGSTTSIAGGQGGQAQNCTPINGPFSLRGASAGGNPIGLGSNGVTGFDNGVACAAGAGGGGITSANIINNGGPGGNISDEAGAAGGRGTAGSTAGIRDGGAGSAFANNIMFDINNTISNGLGGSGGGGAAGDTAGTIAGGTGGAGGPGAGGAGGGASANGANSGAGGSGGDGLCVVIEYYGA